MNLEEFINTNPNFYGNGNANLFYSSSISGSDNIPIAPFVIQGLSIPNTDLNSNNLVSPLKEVTKFKFDFGGSRIEATITGRQKKNDYTFFSIEPITVGTLPAENTVGSRIEDDSEFVFNPYFESGYFNNDYNPLQGNSTLLLRNSATMVVDRQASQITPGNLDALIAGTAERAEIVDSFNTTAGLISGRHVGSKTTSGGAKVDISAVSSSKESFTRAVLANQGKNIEPAVVFKSFVGSEHPQDAITSTIKGLAEREKISIFFKEFRTTISGVLQYPNFPAVGSTVFLNKEDSKELRKAATAKVYSIQTDQVFVTNESGLVTSIE